MKRQIFVCVALILFLVPGLRGECGPFQDVPSTAWYCDSLQKLLTAGIIESREEFRPSAPISRAEFLKLALLSTKSGLSTFLCEASLPPFPDVALDSWYVDYVWYAKREGIVRGRDTGDGPRFFPEESIKREEAARLLIIAAELDRRTPSSKLFADDKDISDWAYIHVYIGKELGFFNGHEKEDCDGNPIPANAPKFFFPQTDISRAEAASIVARSFDYFSRRRTEALDFLQNETFEAKQPILLSSCLNTLSLSAGTNYLKFRVTPGNGYSLIVDTGVEEDQFHVQESQASWAQGVQGRIYGIARPTHDIPGNTSGARSSIMFESSSDGDPYTNYVILWLEKASTVTRLRLLEYSAGEKAFDHPFSSAGGSIVAYYNHFGHRDFKCAGCSVSLHGHDGVDIQPYTPGGQAIDFARPVVAVAGGEVIRIDNLPPGNLGMGVWIWHPTENCTSLYGHLNPVTAVKVGDQVVKGQELGTFRQNDEKHLHLEILPGMSTAWSGGYSNGSAGQVDPLSVIFEQ